MTTTPTTRVTDLARRHRIDCDTATYPLSQYDQFYGIQAAKLIEDIRTQDGEDYDSAGAGRDDVTGYSWRIEIKFLNSKNPAGTSFDAVHKFLRTMFNLTKASNVANAEFGVRWYDREGLDDGQNYEGRVYVKSWAAEDDKGAQDLITIVLQGQGPQTEIANPNADYTPVVTGVSPSSGSTAGGELVVVSGGHFTGTTAVDFGATPADDFVVISDSVLVALTPAVAASTVQVKVTNPTGASADVAADNFTFA